MDRLGDRIFAAKFLLSMVALHPAKLTPAVLPEACRLRGSLLLVALTAEAHRRHVCLGMNDNRRLLLVPLIVRVVPRVKTELQFCRSCIFDLAYFELGNKNSSVGLLFCSRAILNHKLAFPVKWPHRTFK